MRQILITNSTVLMTGKNKSRLFWVLNSVCWSFFMLREFLVIRYYDPGIPEYYFMASLTYISGFAFSVLLRFLFIARISHIRSLLKMAVLFGIILVICSILWRFMDTLVSYPFWSEQSRMKYNAYSWMDHVMGSFQYLVTLLIWGAVYFIIFLFERLLVQQIKTRDAENLAMQVRFQLLQNQLNPHFLFNSLNSIRALIFENQQKAAELVTELSVFLRYNLQQSDTVFISLREEISTIENYLAIEKKRYEEDLHVSIEIGPDCGDFLVIPNLLLPLIDNAVKHGMQTSEMPLLLKISAKANGEKLVLEVFNTGHWNTREENGSGRGLLNERERLENIYRDNFNLTIRKEENYVNVIIEIPNIHERLV